MLNNRYLPLLLNLLALLGLMLLGWQLFAAAPSWQYQKVLELLPTQGKVWKLGYSELGQHNVANAADHQHLQLSYDKTPENPQGWLLANLSASKSLLYQYSDAAEQDDHQRLRHWQLAQGDEIHLDSIRLTVQALDAEHLVLLNQTTQQQAEWRKHWLGSRLTVTGASNFSGCDHRVRGFYLGGDVQCASRWRLPALPTKAASIALVGEHFMLRPHDAETAFRVVRSGQSTDLMAMEVPLVMGERHITEIIVGKTRYATRVDGTTGKLTLTASSGIHLFPPNAASDNTTPHGRIPWQPQSAELWLGWAWSSALGLLFLLSVLVAWLVTIDRRANRESPRFMQDFLFLLVPWAALWWGISYANHLPVLAGITAGTWVVLTLLLWRQGMLAGIAGWVWWCVLLLAGIGLLVQMQLAIGADNTKWQRFAILQAWSLLGIAWFVTVLALFSARALGKLWEAAVTDKGGHLRSGWLSGLSFLLALVLLALLKVAGGEAGVSGFQPAELAKGVMALLLAIAMVMWVDLRTHFLIKHDEVLAQEATRWRSLLRLLFWVAALGILATLLLGAVRDFSPVLILFLLIFGFVWAARPWLSAKRRKWVYLLPLLVLLMLVSAWHYPVLFAKLLANLQGERFLVWANPWAYPDLGLQAQRSLSAIYEAGWWPRDGFGSNGEVMTIPAVQNDFILAFILAKIGALGGLILLLIQLFWVGLLFGLHQALLVKAKGERGTVRAMQLLAWLLYGLAWLQIAHWLISWGNVLGLLPIMGQPMTWISSGNSHLLALGLPTVLLALLAARVLDVRA
ncbi:MAG: FtsW/RodA/SpoVE family cell cycle protein [Thiolinea sp.]